MRDYKEQRRRAVKRANRTCYYRATYKLQVLINALGIIGDFFDEEGDEICENFSAWDFAWKWADKKEPK